MAAVLEPSGGQLCVCPGAAKRDHDPPDGLPGRAHECMASRGSWVCSVPAEDCATPSMDAH